ncbi:Lysyl endopeptidase [Frankliniella fusca]|uniref:Lysyl endopeptidase n=1 Tax=Frankliniella fusca TaxID=407009 RepID=A0AAE1I252_9NEOP|nr:Lysyl endopeptidase [Frankliniella fusca]KAK3931938.1 Lysyl endopeptidase [Frankliniella fusca]
MECLFRKKLPSCNTFPFFQLSSDPGLQPPSVLPLPYADNYSSLVHAFAADPNRDTLRAEKEASEGKKFYAGCQSTSRTNSLLRTWVRSTVGNAKAYTSTQAVPTTVTPDRHVSLPRLGVYSPERDNYRHGFLCWEARSSAATTVSP